MSEIIVEKTSGLAQMGKMVDVSSLQVTGRLSCASTIGCPLRKQSRSQIVPTLVHSRGQRSMFHVPPLLGAAIDKGMCNGAGAQWGCKVLALHGLLTHHMARAHAWYRCHTAVHTASTWEVQHRHIRSWSLESFQR